MILLMKPGPGREIVRALLGVVLLVVGLFVKATTPHWLLISVGIFLIIWGIVGSVALRRKRRTAGVDSTV